MADTDTKATTQKERLVTCKSKDKKNVSIFSTDEIPQFIRSHFIKQSNLRAKFVIIKKPNVII